MTFSSWQRQRSEFNHDWLKNRFLNCLRGFLSLLDTSSPNPDSLFEQLNGRFWEWSEKIEISRWLASNCEIELSPVCYFDQVPLSRGNTDLVTWLRPLTHELWCHRSCIRTRKKELEKCINEADDIYKAIKKKFGSMNNISIEEFRQLRDRFIRLRTACNTLSSHLSEFRKIMSV